MEDIIYKSHWSNTAFTDSEYPVAAKHFALGFETTDLHNLLNFGYSLVDEKENLIKFQDNKDKIPALKFTIQVIN